MVILDLEREPGDQAPALGRRQPAPGTVEGGAGGLDRDVDVGCVATGDAGEFLAGGGVELGDGFACLARHIAAVDEMLIHVGSDRSGRRRGPGGIARQAAGWGTSAQARGRPWRPATGAGPAGQRLFDRHDAAPFC